MKSKLFILSLLLVFSLKAFSQKDTDVVELSLPTGISPITKEEFSTRYLNYFDTVSHNVFTSFYSKNNILMGFTATSVIKVSKRSLESQQKLSISSYDKLPGTKVLSSKIVTSNKIRFLLIYISNERYLKVRFVSDYDSKNRCIYGDIFYKNESDNQIEALIKEFLGVVHFKE